MRYPRQRTVRLLAGILLFGLALFPVVPGASPSIVDEVRALRERVEALLRAADAEMKRVPALEKESLEEKAKAESLEKELAATREEARKAEAELKELEAQVKAAEEEVLGEGRKSEQLTGFQRAGWDLLLRKKPGDPRAALVRLALDTPAVVSEVLARLTAEPGARAAEAFEQIVQAASEAIATEKAASAGAPPRARAAAKPDVVAAMDALADALDQATACAGVDAGDVRLDPWPAGAADPAAFEALAAPVRALLRERRAALAAAVDAALPRLIAALGSQRLARAVARAALVRGLRDVSWEAARAALGALARASAAPAPEAPIPRGARALLRAIEKRTEVACKPEGR